MPDNHAFDVNAARAARLKEAGPTWTFTVDGEAFAFPREIPRSTSAALRRLNDTDIDGLLKLLLGEEQFARLVDHDLSVADVAAVLETYAHDTGMGGGAGGVANPLR